MKKEDKALAGANNWDYYAEQAKTQYLDNLNLERMDLL